MGGTAMMGLWIAMLLVAMGTSTVSWHHYSRFSRRGHRMSIVAGAQPLGWVFCCALLMDPSQARYRPLILPLALMAGLGGALVVVSTRRKEARLLRERAIERRLRGG